MGKEYRDIKYKVFSIRLSDEVIEKLKKRRLKYKSWNLFIKELLEIKKEIK